METERFTQTLNAQQFEQALAILKREQQVNTRSPRQEKIFKVLNIAIYGLGIASSIFFFLLMGAVMDLLTRDFLILFIFLFVPILGIALIILSIGILMLFFLNLPYIRQLLRQNRLIRQCGLKEALLAPWKEEQRKKRFRNILALGVGFLGPLLLAGYVLLMASFLFLSELSGKTDLGETFGFLGLLLLSFMVGLSIIPIYLVRRSKERLKLISRLYTSLEEQKEKVEQDKFGRTHIPAEAYMKIAQIERAQISRGRVQSIMADLEEPDITPYVIQKSRAAKDAQGRLDGAISLLVQEQIDALMTEPHPPGVAEDSKTDSLKLRVAQTPVIIGYTVDNDTRRVRILSVEITSEESASPSEHGGSKHA
jgi:hypothetical protein